MLYLQQERRKQASFSFLFARVVNSTRWTSILCALCLVSLLMQTTSLMKLESSPNKISTRCILPSMSKNLSKISQIANMCPLSLAQVDLTVFHWCMLVTTESEDTSFTARIPLVTTLRGMPTPPVRTVLPPSQHWRTSTTKRAVWMRLFSLQWKCWPSRWMLWSQPLISLRLQ